MLNNCWVACPWNGMTYFVWFLRRFFVDVFALVLVVVHNVHTSGHSNRRKQLSHVDDQMTTHNTLMYKVFLNLSGNVIIDYLSDYITPHSQMIINIDCASKIHRIRSHSSAQKKLTMLAYMYVIYACILEWASMKESLKQVWKFNIQVVSMHHYTFFLMNYKRPCCVCFVNVAS